MSAWLAGIQDRYAALQPRERRVLSIGAVAAVVIVVGGGLFSLGQRVDAARERVQQKQLDVAFMQQAVAEILAAGPLPEAGAADEPLAALAERAAREAGLGANLAGSEAVGEGSLRISMRNAPFDSLVPMLARLARQSAVSVESATIDATGAPGHVDASIVLRSDARR